WPISYEETYRHLDGAKEILDIADKPLEGYSFEGWTDKRFRIATYALSKPTRFGIKYRQEIEESEAITCLYNANATDLDISDDGSRADKVKIAGYDGRREEVSAARFVVALGGLENPRFMLNSVDKNGQALGNESDWVGRTFMEHFQCRFGIFTQMDESFWSQYMSPLHRGNGRPLLPSFELMEREGIANGTVSIHPASKTKFYGRLAMMRRVRRDVNCTVPRLKAGIQASGQNLICDGEGYFGSILEHLPNRDSRVMVDPNDLDPFGKGRMRLKYEILDRDLHTIRTLGLEVGKAFAEMNIGRARINTGTLNGTPKIEAHAHHMGTTRMASTPSYGVVDENCRIFSKENVYVAGSSVFSTGGGVNPTLTLVSLALRLGEHLGEQLNG
ncbi:MAG: GMC oxidoreductase, partial [Pseudomonadota bacterium]